MDDKTTLKTIKAQYKKIAVYQLSFNEKNVRKITKKAFDRLKNKVLQGLYEPLKVWSKGNVVLSGNQRLAVIRHLIEEDGYDIKSVNCAVYDVDERTARFIQLTENEHEGQYDFDKLVEEMEDFGDLDLKDILDPATIRKMDKKIAEGNAQPPDPGDGTDKGVPGDNQTFETNTTDLIVTNVPKTEIPTYYETMERIGDVTGIGKEWSRLEFCLRVVGEMSDDQIKELL